MNQGNESPAEVKAESHDESCFLAMGGGGLCNCSLSKDQDGSGEAPSPAGVPAPENQIPGPLAPFPGLDFSKPLRCKGAKYPVRILAIDYSLKKPIIGVIMDYRANCANEWHINGQFNPEDYSENRDFLDLENYDPAALSQSTPKGGV